MKDDLMDKVVSSFEPDGQPVSLKYIAYGKLDEVSLNVSSLSPSPKYPAEPSFAIRGATEEEKETSRDSG